ncbi:uncharacterized protein N7503_008090 [Penicillium pulvis]|uniref:uncharacterized protein n=1 Tax=Penicillium pulvis TaxID=1562058 RepID=UPI0025492C05|nr:uncharacterized protein N7503_008090 [Penicillium pulvis]KAJ5792112.1 hypothetical protein N7503_008090 [Penicillium pulvis]
MNLSTTIAELSPPPAGVDLSQDQNLGNNIAIIVVCALAAIVLPIRIYVRIRTNKTLRVDDWIMIIAMAPLGALFAINFVADHYGLGKHVWLCTVGHMITMKKMLFVSLVIYNFELCMIKISILMFYRRVFGMNPLNWLACFFAIGWFIGCTVALCFAPAPISYFWTQIADETGGHYRYSFYNYYIGNAATNVVCDFLVMAVPIPIVWRLKMRVAQKIMVSLVLLLGCFVFAASVIRIHYLTKIKGDGLIDITWTIAPVCLWSTIEPCISVIGSCLPAMQPIVQWALQLEHNYYIRKHMPSRARGSIREIFHGTGASMNASSMERSITPIDSFGGKKEDDVVRLFAHAARVEASPEPDRDLNPLEEYLGLNYIRVQHDVEVTIDRKSEIGSESC